MAFHVPFAHRPSGRHHRQPIYIGFDLPQRKRRNINWWGFNSVVFFFLSFGLLSPFTLLMGLKGLRRRPRKAAIAGTGLSLAGISVMVAGVMSIVHHAEQLEHRRYMARNRALVAEQVAEVDSQLGFAATEFEGYRDDNNGLLPSRDDGNLLAIKHADPWETELMYEVESDYANLRSAGPDRKFFTNDDITHEIEGETEIEPLLPVGIAEAD